METLKTKLTTSISLVCIFIFCFILSMIRWINVFNSNVLVINENINSHITNFSLSLLACVLFGYLLQVFGLKYKTNLVVGVVLIFLNFIYEMFFSILNTLDIVDAIYGMVGIFIGLIYLYIISKYGFKYGREIK